MATMATGTQILSVPFRLTAAGTVATVTQGSDQANAEQIGVILTTIQGERDLAPGFGIPDPAFSGIASGVVASQVAMYGPKQTRIDAVTSTVTPGDQTDVTVTFT